ncbi:hypothetical protein [Aquiflexum sp.]|uniref:hypothetical protein n=1 Tax=Aquiflexum sp. TaxID=1872584 RepID=UPI003594573D
MKKFKDFTVNEIITADFRAGAVFKRFGIDPLLNKEMRIQEVCDHFDLDPNTILDKIIEEMEVKAPKPFKVTA